ncbi:MAG: glycosyltransferase family 2 protein [Candidatus Bathyarchaeota archaeon]|nr:glycosyltransferase family 2 protein [Candidatus Bathyarchaeota archaeon]
MQIHIRFKIHYIVFIMPLIFALISWLYFPLAAQWLITNLFGYTSTAQPVNPVWYWLLRFFYTWYTFLAIGIAGIWIIAAFFAKRKYTETKQAFYPMVSFLVPAYNEEKHIAKCITSLFRCAKNYHGNCEIIVVDDGSTDYTYEVAWATAKLLHAKNPRIRYKITRHMVNLGKAEALKTGVNKALGQLIAVVDGDSEWKQDTLQKLVDYMLANGKSAATGYIHPKTEGAKGNFLVALQQLEYSQGLGIDRCAQALGNCVLVVPGAIGIYNAETLRNILTESSICSVTEDSEITLALYKRGGKVGYLSAACSETDAPTRIKSLWHQRLRWLTGWLHNIIGIHVDLFRKRSWLSVLLWYSFIFEYVGALVDLAAITAFPLLFWFAPDRLNFAYNLIIFAAYGLLISIINQAIALKYAYGKLMHGRLLKYTPFFPFLWLINLFARLRSMAAYMLGSKGSWHLTEASSNQKYFKA